ncbi:MAG: hypothetical protein QXK88_03020 [Desulfurococcaceae archaeon]
MATHILKKIILAFLSASIFFTLFLILSFVISSLLQVPMLDITRADVLLYLGLAVSLSIIASNVKLPIAIVFDAIIALLSLLLIVELIGAGHIRSAVISDSARLNIVLDCKPLFAIMVSFVAFYTLLKIFKRIVDYED